MRSMIWFVMVAAMVLGLVSWCAADVEKQDIPLYDGKRGNRVGDMRINPRDGAEMMWVPVGSFLMGSTQESVDPYIKEINAEDAPTWMRHERTVWFRTEVPQRKVYLSGYWIYKYPVTVAQYKMFLKDKKLGMPEEPFWGWHDDHPMTMVSVEDADAYAEWAQASLPTEAQWEKAARGKDGRQYPWGNEWDPSKCVNSTEGAQMGTEPVGSHPENISPYGVMDMAGNVNEWCADWYDRKYYSYAPNVNPKGPAEGVPTVAFNLGYEILFRSMRGGSWHCVYPDVFRTSHRSSSGLSYPNATYGFRCVVNP